MDLLVIAIIILGILINIAFYEFRVKKKTNDMEVFEIWIQKKLNKRYNK